MINNTPLGITDVVLRDAHQSLLATRMRIDDMLPIADKLDQVGYWSLETWGGATFDACIRYLGEDPWERLRRLKAAMPNTPQQMLLRGQNLLGYRHYADDVVDKFVERAAVNGIGVFRIFDAMNDLRNLEQAVRAALATDAHAQGTMSYTVSPVHDMDYWWTWGGARGPGLPFHLHQGHGRSAAALRGRGTGHAAEGDLRDPHRDAVPCHHWA
jgi:oxaloacetate decarboxylase alpha subunit